MTDSYTKACLRAEAAATCLRLADRAESEGLSALAGRYARDASTHIEEAARLLGAKLPPAGTSEVTA